MFAIEKKEKFSKRASEFDLIELRNDFNYLNKRVIYKANEDFLARYIQPNLINGVMDLKGFSLWSIWDLLDYVINESGYQCEESEHPSEDEKFLTMDLRAMQILKKYGLDIENLEYFVELD